MITPMGRVQWGKTASGVLLAGLVMAGATACGGDAEPKKSAADAKPKAVSVAAAAKIFQAAVTDFDTNGGCQPEPDACWDKMQSLIKPARELRAAMNADSRVGPEFWSEAYALIDKMEKGVAVGKDLGAASPVTNRPDVFGSAHDLSRWLDAHPTQ